MNYHGIIFTDTFVECRMRPLGAYAIANVLRDNGYNILVIDYLSKFRKEDLKDLLKKVIDENTLFVGYSSTFFLNRSQGSFFPIDYRVFAHINNYIKSLNPKIKIAYGGSNSKHFIKFCGEIKHNLYVDYAFHGYSESMILDFVQNLKENKSQRFSNKTNNVYEIDYDQKASQFDFRNSRHKWTDDDIIFEKECLPLEVARGCIFKCKFCAYPLLGKNPKDDSYLKSEENLYLELKENYEKYKTTTYVVADDTFNERTDKIETLIRVRDRLKIDLNFVGYNRIDLIARKPEQLNLLKELNFNGMFFGIESLNYPSAKIIGKGIRPEEVVETLHKIKDAFNNRVSITAGFIIGLPRETPETFNNWSSMIIKDDFPLDSLLFYPLNLAYNTHTESEFLANPTKYGYTVIDEGGYEVSWSNEHWSRKDCEKIAMNISKQIINSGRQKITMFQAASFTSLGYNFEEIMNTPIKDFPEEEKDERTRQQTRLYVKTMLSK